MGNAVKEAEVDGLDEGCYDVHERVFLSRFG
jgi:hypothetical protein